MSGFLTLKDQICTARWSRVVGNFGWVLLGCNAWSKSCEKARKRSDSAHRRKIGLIWPYPTTLTSLRQRSGEGLKDMIKHDHTYVPFSQKDVMVYGYLRCPPRKSVLFVSIKSLIVPWIPRSWYTVGKLGWVHEHPPNALVATHNPFQFDMSIVNQALVTEFFWICSWLVCFYRVELDTTFTVEDSSDSEFQNFKIIIRISFTE